MLFRKKDIPETEEAEYDVLSERQLRKSAGYILIPVVIELLLGGFIFFQAPQAVLSWLYTLVVLLVLTAIVGTWVYNRDGDLKLFSAAASLTAIGIALQLVIDEVYTTFTVFSPLKHLFAFLIAIVFVMLYKVFRKLLNYSLSVWLMMGLSAAVYTILYLYGEDPNGMGTHAWISLGPLTVQMTDFSKIAAVMFYSSLFASKTSLSESKILVLSTAFFLINLAGSVLIHELGSFFILYFLHLSILFIFMDRGKKKQTYLIVIVLITLAALGAAFVLYRMLRPMAEAGTLSGISAFIWPFVRKIYLRFSVTANIYSDPYGAGYQLLQGKKALWMAGFFGNTVNFSAVPVAESDMAFIALVSCFGMLTGFLTVFLFLRILLSGSSLSMRILETSRADAVVVYGVSILLFAQAMLVILGSCNVIPLAGLPIPYLSRGGTYQTIVFSFTGLLLHLSESGEVTEGGVSDEE